MILMEPIEEMTIQMARMILFNRYWPMCGRKADATKYYCSNIPRRPRPYMPREYEKLLHVALKTIMPMSPNGVRRF